MRISSEKSELRIESRRTDQAQEIASTAAPQMTHPWTSKELPPVSDFFLIDQIAGILRDEGKTAAETESILHELGFCSEQIARSLRKQYSLKR